MKQNQLTGTKEDSLSEQVSDEYRQLANSYDKRWSAYLQHTHERALRYLRPEPEDTILDCSGGTGKFAEQLVSVPDTHVVITDFSRSMLDEAEKKFQSEIHRVELIQTDSHSLPFESGRFNKIYNLNSLHFYDSADTVLDEMARVLSPGGNLLVLDWSSDTFTFRLIEKFMRVIGKPFGKVFSRIDLEKSIKSKGLNILHSLNWSWRGWSFAMVIAEKPFQTAELLNPAV